MANSDMVNSVIRALDILEYVSRNHGARLGDAADALGIKRTTAYNLVRTMRSRNFLLQDAGRRLYVGTALREIVEREVRAGVFDRAGREITALAEEFPEAVITFSELSGDEIVCRLRVSPDRPGQIQRPAMLLFSPYASVSGLCVLAMCEGDTGPIERKYSFSDIGMTIWGSREAFNAKLEECRRVGIASRVGERGDYFAAAPCAGNFVLGLRGPAPDSARRAAVNRSLAACALRIRGEV